LIKKFGIGASELGRAGMNAARRMGTRALKIEIFPIVLGYLSHFPPDLVYGPLKYQGFALPNPYTVQGKEHILTVMEFGYNIQALTGQLLKGNLEALKLELGVGTQVFVTDFRRYGTLATSSWTQHT
jgi:hypothetical protein